MKPSRSPRFQAAAWSSSTRVMAARSLGWNWRMVGGGAAAQAAQSTARTQERTAHDSSEVLAQLFLRGGVEAEGDLLADHDDRAADAGAVGGQPGDQLVAGQAFGLGAPLGGDQLPGVADQHGE